MTNPFREHLRLSVIEVKRIVNRKQFLLAVFVVLLLVYYGLFSFPPSGQPPGLFGIAATAEHDPIMNCFVAAVGGAAALAVDTETGFLGLALSRNIRRWHHILHKIIAMWVVITAITFARYALLYIVGAFVLPWDVPHLGECQLYVANHLGQYHCAIPSTFTPLERARGPFPALFLTHPVLNDLIGVVMIAAGTSAMALLGIFAAACGANGFVAMSLPVVVAFTFRVMLQDILPRWADPTGLVNIFWGYYQFGPGMESRLWVWLAAWLGWTGGLTGLSMFIAEKRELATKGDTD